MNHIYFKIVHYMPCIMFFDLFKSHSIAVVTSRLYCIFCTFECWKLWCK